MSEEPGPQEMYCRSCGEIIKQRAELCPHCGVRNEKPTTKQGTTTTISPNWWVGVVLFTGLWAVALGLAAAESLLSTTLLQGQAAQALVIGTWVGLPIVLRYDAKYARANSPWNPGMLWYYFGSFFSILVAISASQLQPAMTLPLLTGLFYLYRRHKLLGTP